MVLNAPAANDLKTLLDSRKIPLPASLMRAMEIDTMLTAHREEPPTPAFLELDDDELIAHLETRIVRTALSDRSRMQAYHPQAIAEVTTAAFEQASIQLAAGGVDEIIEALRPAFNDAAAVLSEAAKLGFTSKTTAQDVIDRNDDNAMTVWRALDKAMTTLHKIADIRRKLSVTLDASPTLEEQKPIVPFGIDYVTGNRVIDWSVAFAAGDNWGVLGEFHIDRIFNGTVDWLALAGSGLHLNTPSEVRAKHADRLRTTPRMPAIPLHEQMGMDDDENRASTSLSRFDQFSSPSFYPKATR